ncbi:MAG TPA: DNA gyrase subunit A [Fibrobacteria bacterium]|nr:DNA gyrase subunit A [Fibrobacteria bacterium]
MTTPALSAGNDKIVNTFIEEEMKISYLRYSMSVIVARALPDVRDGLKPVHRRILYGMENISLFQDRPYKKSANIVGEVMGKYHPHGDSAIYESIVRMAQDFSMRYPLVDGQGNFGSIDGDPPAAMRYTEARMKRFAEMMLQDLEKETVDFVPNYDTSLQEPTVLPSAFPNLLVNGSTGIAVGMATNVPPHNLIEIINACQAMIKNPDLPDDELLALVSGPDFPTGGTIHGRNGIRAAYLTGKGKILVRAKTEVQERNGRQRIEVTEIPYQVNKTNLLEKMAALVREKVIEGISDLRDESDKDGMSIIIELKKDAFPDIVLNMLYKHTQLQETFSIHNLALVGGRPRTLSLRELVRHFIDHRHDVVERRARFDLRKAEDRAHILEGLRIALDHIEEIIKLIRASADTAEAKAGLMERFGLTERQSDAILEMTLRRLTGLERDKIENEYRELQVTIADLREILADRGRRMAIISAELKEIAAKYGDERRTVIEDATDDLTYLDLIANEPMVITVSHTGYIKRIGTDAYKTQGRGGKGISATGLKEEDFVEHLFIAWTHSYILIFTNLGRCHWVKVYEIPEGSRSSKGKALVNLINLQEGEKVSAFVPVKDFEDVRSVVLVTEKGIINKMSLEAFSRPRANGINAITLDEGDRLSHVVLASEADDVMIGTRSGQAIRFSMSKFRQTGRGTRGVRGITLEGDDLVIGMIVAEKGYTVLTITELGYGKRTDPAEYRITDRGGKGVRSIKVTDKNGAAVCIESVREGQEILVITKEGNVIRLGVADINLIGRDTQGVRVIRLNETDLVTDVAVVESEDVDPGELEIHEAAKATSADGSLRADAAPSPETGEAEGEAGSPEERQ